MLNYGSYTYKQYKDLEDQEKLAASYDYFVGKTRKLNSATFNQCKILEDIDRLGYKDMIINEYKRELRLSKNDPINFDLDFISDLYQKMIKNDDIDEIIEFYKNYCIVDDNGSILYKTNKNAVNYNFELASDDVTVNMLGDGSIIEINANHIILNIWDLFEDEDDLYDLYRDLNGDVYCRDDLIFLNDEFYHVDSDLITTCDSCSDYHLISSGISDNNFNICENCSENYYTCESCSDLVHVDYISCSDDGYITCENCYTEENSDSRIKNYSYKPSPIFYGSSSYHYGIELEIVSSDFSDNLDHLEDHEELYFKDDSSVSGGFEIVSHPMSYDHIMDSSIFDTINDLDNCSSYNKGGMHIHISRSAFLNDDHFSKFYNFINDEINHDLINTIAQRKNSSWAKFNPYNSDKNINDTTNYNNIGRYAAVNLNNLHTVEIRIFNGNLKKDRLLKNVEFLECLLNYTKQDQDQNFISYLASNKDLYINLYNYLEEK